MERKGHDGFSLPMDIVCIINSGGLIFHVSFCEYEDRTFLTTQHKSKRLCKHCAEVLAKLEQDMAKHEEIQPWTDLPDFSVFEGA